jgi:hypothetical protein
MEDKPMKRLHFATLAGMILLLLPPSCVPQAAAKDNTSSLKEGMQKLWTEHVVWTRNYIVASLADQPDQEAASKRLLKNQEDIGKAVGRYYGKAAGNKLTGLLKEHITIAVDFINGLKVNDERVQAAAAKKWRQNADEIATFLSQANPHWPKESILNLLNVHLDTTTKEVMARYHKSWDEDVRAFDAVYDHILRLSQAFTSGIVNQFPKKFKG